MKGSSALLFALFLAQGLTLGPAFAGADDAPPVVAGKRAAPREDLIGRTVYQTLIGEFALRQGNIDLAASAWADLAYRTRDPQVFARAIEVLGAARKYDTARELADLWLKIDPESPKARQLQASILLASNRLDDMAPHLGTLLSQEPGALPINLLQLNRLLARHNDKKAVLKLVDRVVSPYLDMPEAHFALAQAAHNAGDELRALSEADKALHMRPDWEAAALIRAQLLARAQPDKAIDGLQQFVSAHPKAHEARLMLARLLISQKRLTESRQHFERLVQDAPNNPEILYPLAMLALQQGDTAFSRIQLERLLNTAYPDKSSVHFFLGQIAEEQQQIDVALNHYQQVVSGDQRIAALGRSALLLHKSGQSAAAESALKAAQPANDEERTQLILVESQWLREAGRSADAFVRLEKAVSEQPHNTQLLYEAALLAERQGQPAKLEAHLQALLLINPEHAHAMNALAYSWAERNIRLNEAETLIRRALHAAPDDAYIIDSQGWIFFRQGRLNDALSTLEKAYALKNDGEIAAHIGEVLWAMKRQDDARRFLREASQRFPDNDALRTLIKKLPL